MEASEKVLRSHWHLQPACSEGVNLGGNKGKLLPPFHWLKKDEWSGCPKPHNNPQQRQMRCQGRELAVKETEGSLQSQTHPLAAPGCRRCRPVGTVGVSEHFWSPTSAVTAGASGRESVLLPPMQGRPVQTRLRGWGGPGGSCPLSPLPAQVGLVWQDPLKLRCLDNSRNSVLKQS